MRERPMLFSGSMVQALLADEKTQTRRVACFASEAERIYWVDAAATAPAGEYSGWVREGAAPLRLPLRCPYGVPGDRLWVRETLRLDVEHNIWRYDADGSFVEVVEAQRAAMVAWAHHKPGAVCVSIHMPRFASRITLELTDVRAQRVQDISEDDAAAEGIEHQVWDQTVVYRNYARPPSEDAWFQDWSEREPWFSKQPAASSYMTLWNSINGHRPGCDWSANPWVWALTVKRVEQTGATP